MSIPETTSIGDTVWSQTQDELEIKIPLNADTVKPRELNVEIKDGEVLIVSQGSERLYQWRLYSGVKEEVEWQLEDGNQLVIAAEKQGSALWQSLISLPLKADDEILVPIATIDRMLASQLPSLPSTEEERSAEKEEKKEGEEEDDLDKLLDEAAAEVTKKDEEDEVGYAAYMKAELKNFKDEAKEIATALAEVNGQLENGLGEGESEEAALKKKAILDEMLRIHNQVRELRTKPSSMSNLITCTLLDLQKARVNVGSMEENEVEEFKTEEEKTLTASQLMARGLESFQENIEATLHLLRLAAIHHKHESSIVLLYDIYSQLSSPRGAYLLLKRALDDEEPSAICNHKVGELYDEGARHFLPLFPAALYFYQRAAALGHTNSMLSLAQLWLRGCTSTSMMPDEDAEAQKDMRKYHAWLQRGIDRGSGSALFVKGCMYIKGEHGVAKDYANAKRYIDAALGAQPQLSQSAPQILLMLEQLRASEELAEKGVAAPSAAPATAAATSQLARRDPQASEKAAKRLNALTQGAGAGSQTNAQRAKPGSAKRKQFWERAAVASVLCYGAYSLAFPIRAVLLPYFYALVGSLTEFIPWLGNSDFDTSLVGF